MLKSKSIIANESACQKLTEHEITHCQIMSKSKMDERYCLYGKAFKKGWSSPKELDLMFPQEMARRIILSAEGHPFVSDVSDDEVGELLEIKKHSHCKSIIASESACQKLIAYEIIDCQRMSNRCRYREMAERYCLYGEAFKNGWSSPRQLDQMFPQEIARRIILTAEGFPCVSDVSDDVVGKLLDRTLQDRILQGK